MSSLNSKIKSASELGLAGSLAKEFGNMLSNASKSLVPLEKYNTNLFNEISSAEKKLAELSSFNPGTPPSITTHQESIENLINKRDLLDPESPKYKSINESIKNKNDFFRLENENYRNQNVFGLAEYNNKKSELKNELDLLNKRKEDWHKSIGTGLGTVGLLGGGIAASIGSDYLKARKAQRAFNLLEPEAKLMVSNFKTFEDMGYKPRDMKEMIESLVKEKELGIKDLEERKIGLDTERIKNELDKQDTILGRLSRTSVGQFIGPLAGGAMLAGGGLAAAKVMDTMRSMGPADPMVDIQIKNNLQHVLDTKPMLKGIDRSLLLDYYRLIFRIAPSVGRDVHVASNLLEKMVNYGGADHVLMSELAETEKKMRDNSRMQMDYINTGSQLFGLAR